MRRNTRRRSGGSGGGTGALPACAVHLFDGDNFDASDDNDIIRGPGDFATLKNLPGATTDWAAEADSLKVGSGATVQIWSQENFQGDSKTYQPGSQDGSVMEFRSMKISC